MTNKADTKQCASSCSRSALAALDEHLDAKSRLNYDSEWYAYMYDFSQMAHRPIEIIAVKNARLLANVPVCSNNVSLLLFSVRTQWFCIVLNLMQLCIDKISNQSMN